MAWFTRLTRFGDIHSVYAQEAEDSCGIACVMMCVFKINKLSPTRTASYLESQIDDIYGKVSGTHYDGTSYTYTNYLADTLNKLNCGKWESINVGAAGVSAAIIKSVGIDVVGAGPVINYLHRNWPIIVLVNWTVGGGGHFVVVDTVNDFFGALYASVCDPWDGDVHITRFKEGSPLAYEGRHQPLSWDTGGKKHDYTPSNAGTTKGWIVRRVS